MPKTGVPNRLNKMNAYCYCFPPSILNHELTMQDGRKVNLLVDSSETYGHALTRSGIKGNEVKVISYSAPISYEHDERSATQ